MHERLQLSDRIWTSKPWLEARSLVHYQNPGFKPGVRCMEDETNVDSIRTYIPMLEAMSLHGGCTTLYRKCCLSKEVL